MEPAEAPLKPSWLRWPPNCCETCVGWKQEDTYVGKCFSTGSLDHGTTTDSRYRCPAFQRKEGI